MPFSDIIGQPRALDALSGALRSGAVHHAWLFGGPAGVGKEKTAVAFVQSLLCPKGCGACAVCQRIAHRNHPDVTWLMAEEEQVARGLAGRSDFAHVPSKDIKVEQVRQLHDRLSLRSLEGGRKVAVVAGAERMTVQAQNALLKTLEEPTPGTVIILVAAGIDRLLPTIRSRCAKVHFGPLPTAFISEQLRKNRALDEPSAQLAALMAGGSLARAQELDVEALGARKGLIEAYEAVGYDDAQRLLAFAEEHGASRETAEAAFELLEWWVRDLAVAQCGAGDIANGDLVELCRTVAGRLVPADVHRRRQLLVEARQAVGVRNGSPRLAIERMLIRRVRAERRG